MNNLRWIRVIVTKTQIISKKKENKEETLVPQK